MFYLTCQKGKENDICYIWANENNLNEWCLSEFPCLFNDFDTTITLKNIVEESSCNLKNIVVVQNNK